MFKVLLVRVQEAIYTGRETVRSATALAVLQRALDLALFVLARAAWVLLDRVKWATSTLSQFALDATASATCINRLLMYQLISKPKTTVNKKLIDEISVRTIVECFQSNRLLRLYFILHLH